MFPTRHTPRALVLLFYLTLIFTREAGARPSPLTDMELAGVKARTGVAITFDDLTIQNQGEIFRFYPDFDGIPQSWMSLDNMGSTLDLTGTLAIEAKPYASPQTSYIVQDQRKEYHDGVELNGLIDNYYPHMAARGELTDAHENAYIHVYTEWAFSKPSEAEARAPSVVQLGLPTLTSSRAFDLKASGVQTTWELDAAEGYVHTNPTHTTAQAHFGNLAISGLTTQGCLTLYAHGDIPGYVSGEGIALELRSKTSMDALTLTAPDGETLLSITGIHMGEGFDQSVHTQFGKWGEMGDGPGTLTYDDGSLFNPAPLFPPITPPTSEYYATTYDPDGWFGDAYSPTMVHGSPGDGHPVAIAPHLISAPFDDPSSVYDIYGGMFMNGAMEQIEFSDRLSGNTEFDMYHGQRTDGDSIDHTLTAHGENGDAQLKNQDDANAIRITERPITIGVKSSRHYWRFDEATNALTPFHDTRSHVAINWPRHGSVRIENITGYNSGDPEDYPYGNTMGSVIIDGMRTKHHYIEFPGRMEQYTITQQNNHTYVYDAGRLPDAMNQNGISASQGAWDPIGRGQLTFLERLGSPEIPNTGKWDMYMVRAQVDIDGVMQDKSFWRIYEPVLPASPDFTDDGRILPPPL